MRTIALGNGSICRDPEGIDFNDGGTSGRHLRDWRLVTSEDATTIETAGHFNPLAGIMQVGEAIVATLNMDGTPQLRIYVVTANEFGKITIAPLTVV